MFFGSRLKICGFLLIPIFLDIGKIKINGFVPAMSSQLSNLILEHKH